MKGLLEQPNGLARRIISKGGSDASRLLDKTEAFIRKQPRVTGRVRTGKKIKIAGKGRMGLCVIVK